ncbi:MAG: TIM-barrel domain-containing protein [Bacteroidota bacterium]
MFLTEILRKSKAVSLAYLLIFLSTYSFAQLSLNVSKPLSSQKLEFVYDAGKGNKALFGLQEELYFHTGVITSTSRDAKDWKFVVGNWGKADNRVKMTALGGDKYRFEFVPDEFYNYPETTKVQQLAFVFRNENGEKVGKTDEETDILIPVNGYKVPQKDSATYSFKKREYLSHKLTNGQLQVFTDYGSYLFTPFSEDILHIKYLKENENIEYKSHAVVLNPQQLNAEITDTCDEINYSVGNVSLTIQKSPLEISYSYKNSFLFKEEMGFFERSDNSGIRFYLSENEHIYGTGERAVPMNRRGYKLELYNKPDYNYGLNALNLNYSLPLILSSKKYLVLFDNPRKGYFDIGYTDENILEFGAIGGLMNYYIVGGNDFEEINENYAKLTGFQPLPPRWALGNLQSRMAYRTQSELENVVNQMQAKDFPLDAVIIDFYWFGDSIKGGLGNLKWYEKNWPQPEKMIADFKSKGVKTILITEPMVIDTAYWFTHGDTSKLFATNAKGETYVMNEFYFGPGALLDIFKQESKDWFWEQYDKQIIIGVEGWWGDLGEPETHPSDMIHINGTADEVHNIYGHEWEKMLFEKYREHYPNRRLFHLNRAGAAGSQRYSIFPWSGDVSRSWSGFQAQLPLMLNMSISGLGYISSDLGGFAQGVKDEELYRRWLQFGVFNPIFRPHGSDIPSEPIFFSEKTQDIVRESIKLRYRLMPYLYTLAYENTKNGKPLVKPLFYLEPENKDFLNYSDAYLFGDAFLVAPVIHPDIKKMKIRFPKGIWYNFYTREKVLGGQELEVNVSENNIPAYVKEGAFVPMVPNFYSTDNYPNDLEFHYYPKENAETHSLFYEDDGELFSSITDEKFQLTNLLASNSGNLLHIVVESNEGMFKNKPAQRDLTICIYDFKSNPKRIFLNGRRLKETKRKAADYFWEKESETLRITMPWNNKDLDLRIEK